MKYTGNFNLKKPEGNDTIDINDLNDNFDTIDKELAKIPTKYAPAGFGLGTIGTRLAEGTDLNTIINNGWYDVVNPLNGVSGLTWHKLLVIASGDVNYVTQLAFSMIDGNEMYIRNKIAGTWSGWSKIAKITDIPTSGGDADTLKGYTAEATPVTTEKKDIIGMINETFTSASNGKTSIAAAITGKGIPASSDDSFSTLASKISSIPKAQGNATESQVLVGATFTNADGQLRTGTMPNNGSKTITPSTVDQVLGSGYYNGITIKGDSNLQSENIVAGKSIFGIPGAYNKKYGIGDTISAGSMDIDYSNVGKDIWATTSNLGDPPAGIDVDYEGNIYYGISYTGDGIYKYDSNGNLVWFTNTDYAITGLVVDKNTNYLYAVDSKGYVYKYTLSGSRIWRSSVYLGPGTDITIDKNGYVYTANNNGWNKFEPSTGTHLVECDDSSDVSGITVDDNGYVYVCCGSGYDDKSNSSLFKKYTNNGDYVFSVEDEENAKSILVHGAYIYVLTTERLYKYDVNGNLIWSVYVNVLDNIYENSKKIVIVNNIICIPTIYGIEGYEINTGNQMYQSTDKSAVHSIATDNQYIYAIYAYEDPYPNRGVAKIHAAPIFTIIR